jgi:hypothetical protein
MWDDGEKMWAESRKVATWKLLVLVGIGLACADPNVVFLAPISCVRLFQRLSQSFQKLLWLIAHGIVNQASSSAPLLPESAMFDRELDMNP